MKVSKEHKCNKVAGLTSPKIDDHFFGPSVLYIEKIDKKWIAHNDEYGSVIKFCPFCGVELD